MGKHTPGPWSRHKYAHAAVIADDGVLVANCGGHANSARDQGQLIAEQEANARLIASAPRMFALLERIRDDQSWRTNDNTIWPELIATIKEATGGTP